LRLEGVIGKRRDAPYESGRSRSWIKLKCTHRQEFVVIGHTDPEGSRVGIGALLLAIHAPDGTLRYAARSAPASTRARSAR
jgi:bifunctional non-homologous end joining protein LigD